MSAIRERLLALEPTDWTKYPVLASIESVVGRDDALAQSRARQEDTIDWCVAGLPEEEYHFSRVEYLVREWSFDAIYLLRARTPGLDPDPPVIIGRSQRCDVCIPDHLVSGRHAAVFWHAGSGQYCIRDMGSRNGAFINGAPVPADGWMSLSSGDLVIFGDRVLVFFTPSMLARVPW